MRVHTKTCEIRYNTVVCQVSKNTGRLHEIRHKNEKSIKIF